MVTTVGMENDVVDLVRDLMLLDYDAVDAYEAAIERLGDPISKERLAEFRDDHRRHTRELGALLREWGETPPAGGDAKSLLTQGKVALGALMGDRAILEAMRSNEDDTNTAYERAVGRRDLDPALTALVEKNLDDERRHCAWIQGQLAAMARL